MSILIALAALLLFVVVATLLRRLAPAKATPEPSAPPAMRPPRPPFGSFIDTGHSWLRLMPNGTLRIGIDDFLAEALGSVDGVQLPTPGQTIERGAPLITLRLGDEQLVVRSPISGEVMQHNPTAQQSPKTITADPYGLGWLVALRTQDHKEAIKPLHVGNGAIGFLRRELARLGDYFVSRAAEAPLLADGGLPLRGAVGQLDKDGLESFTTTFLRHPDDA